MDILVCGTQIPFMSGGAELHMANLVEALGRHHRAELVRLPAAWEADRLFDAALAWRLVPLDAELVIATNFPSYFARHPRKRVWLFHQHRGAYDGADASWSDLDLDDDSLETQRLLSDWDVRALEEAEELFTTSARVAERLAFYNGLAAEVLYHPPPLYDQLHPGPLGDYVLCPTRLEHNKRPQLLVEGLARSHSGCRAVLAGRGSMEAELRQRAKRLGVDPRLELPGFITDDELVAHFAACRAVVYAPVDEDYGYVTLQAFYAAKPVITASDSGGVLEWVQDGVTGLVTDGSPEEMGAAIDRLAGDDELAQRLGRAGQARVADLNWDHVVERLTR